MSKLGAGKSGAHAGELTLSVDLNGLVIYSATSTSPDQTVSANLTDLNAAPATNGSAYVFNSLSANSNFTGNSVGFRQTNGQISISGSVGTTLTLLSIDTTQSGFLTPFGPGGALVSSAGGDYINVVGSTTYSSDIGGYNSPPLTFVSSSLGSNAFSGATPSQSIGTIPSDYSLSNHFLIGITQAADSNSEGFSGSVVVTTGAVPEPTSIIMLMPLVPLALASLRLRARRVKS